MTDTASILRSKMRQPAEGADAQPDRALSRAVVRAADGAGGLTLTIAETEEREVFADRLADHLGSDGLILGIEDAMSLCGAFVVGSGLRDALIEMATRGELRSADARARPPTQTDAELVRPMVDQILAERSGAEPGAARRSGDMIESARALILMLPDAPLRLTWLHLAIGEGGRRGALGLVHPVARPADEAPPPRATEHEGGSLQTAIMAAPACLDAVLHRQDLPLSEVRGLRRGQLLRLAGAQLDAVRLEARGGGRPLAGRLGQVAGRRALRIETGAIPDLAGLPMRPGGMAPSDEGG